MRPTSAAALAVAALVGALVGGSIPPLVERADGVVPTVPWSSVLTLAFLAVVLGTLAWTTWRRLRRPGPPLDPGRAVMLLLLGTSCALVGAAVCGGYLAFALTYLGDDATVPRERFVRGLLASAAALLVVVGGAALERACVVPGGPDAGGAKGGDVDDTDEGDDGA